MATGSAIDVYFEKVNFDGLINTNNFVNKGSFGAIYGPFPWKNKMFAIKQILICQEKLNEFRIKAEFKKPIWTSLKHEHLIEIYYVRLEPKALYIIMEYASGGSLRHLLDTPDVKVLHQIDVSNWARQIAEGMLYLHDKGIVHRDLKSSNIVVMKPFDSLNAHLETILKITDFDNVQEDAGTATMSFSGTIAYMAPEVLTDQRFSKASDVWSYGVVMWEMLTRELPHNGQAIVPLTKKASTGELTLPIPGSTPKEFQELLSECWYEDTKSRLRFKTIIYRLNSICESEMSKQKQEQERKLWAEEKKQLLEKIQELEKKYLESKVSKQEVEHERKLWTEEKKQLLHKMEELEKKYSDNKEKYLNLDLELKRERTEKDHLNKETQEHKRLADSTVCKNKELERERELWAKQMNQLMKETQELRISSWDSTERKNKELQRERELWAEEKKQFMKKIQELQKSNWDTSVCKPKELVRERELWAEEKKQLMKKTQELEKTNWENTEKCVTVGQELQLKQIEIDRLHEQAQQYKRLIAEFRYNSIPFLEKMIRTKAAEDGKKGINGLAILDKELFVVTDKSSEVEVYDLTNLGFCRRWNLKELIRSFDLVSCKGNKCLYIFDFKGKCQSNEIFRIDPNGKLIKNWSTGGDYGWGLSVTEEANVLLTVYNKGKLNEYSPDGQLIREINLSSAAGINKPFHAIKLPNGYFLLSHGDVSNDVQGVCILDAYGKPKKTLGGKPGPSIGQLNNPVYMFVDGNGFVMVADHDNGRVFLLDSDLEFKREILSKEKNQALQNPWRILLHQDNGRLFVADNEPNSAGRTLVYDFK